MVIKSAICLITIAKALAKDTDVVAAATVHSWVTVADTEAVVPVARLIDDGSI